VVLFWVACSFTTLSLTLLSSFEVVIPALAACFVGHIPSFWASRSSHLPRPAYRPLGHMPPTGTWPFFSLSHNPFFLIPVHASQSRQTEGMPWGCFFSLILSLTQPCSFSLRCSWRIRRAVEKCTRMLGAYISYKPFRGSGKGKRKTRPRKAHKKVIRTWRKVTYQEW